MDAEPAHPELKQLAASENYIPTHTDFVRVSEFNPGAYSAGLRTLKAFKAGETMAYCVNATKAKTKTYTSVQWGPGPEDNMELNDDLAYINHSCEPNVAVDVSSVDPAKWHLRALKDIKQGELLSFFYLSTEWHMTQPFDCHCGTTTCLGKIQGAVNTSKDDLLARRWVNPHILRLAELRDSEPEGAGQSRL